MRLDRFLRRQFPALPAGQWQKAIRLKKVKIDGRAGSAERRLAGGETICLYLPDEALAESAPANPPDPLLARFHPHVRAVYEDENILLVDKKPGLITHPDQTEKVNTLVTHVRAWLYQKGEYGGRKTDFCPAPANRIDRFTGGIVMFAKNREALLELDQRIRSGEIGKYYLCVVAGTVRPEKGVLHSYLLSRGKHMEVLRHSAPGAKEAVTEYRVLCAQNHLSLVECALKTGRTHQIRAQFADFGHPLIGDTQYGSRSENEKYRLAMQALCAWRVQFNFSGDSGVLSGLAGRSFEVKDVPFVRRFFPDCVLPAHGDSGQPGGKRGLSRTFETGRRQSFVPEQSPS
ncbi:MAG: RluA family pseudouridine synthase [Clostridia bacterium]|nr:RluA family pseudouridine synthase [Clostridia bacterium]